MVCLVFYWIIFWGSVQSPALVWAADDKGLVLMTGVFERDRGSDSSARVKMTLTERDGSTKELVYTMSLKREEPGHLKTLIRFEEPDDVRHTGFLSLSKNGMSDQHLYLPALRRTKRILSSNRSGSFVGSELYYEDFDDRPPGHDRHRWVKASNVGRRACQVVESVPVEPSIYNKRLSCIDPKKAVALRTLFYQDGKLKKTFVAKQINRIQGFWTITRAEIEDEVSGHKTLLQTSQVKYNQGLSERLFSKRELENP